MSFAMFVLFFDSKILWKFVTKHPFIIYKSNPCSNFELIYYLSDCIVAKFQFHFLNELNIMWMIFLFKAWCESKVHSLYHCVASSFVILDSRITPMYFQRTCISYFCLHNRSENITKWMKQLVRKRGKGLWWNSQNPTNNHNRRLIFQKQCLVCPLNMIVVNHTNTTMCGSFNF
jgi:hypothetical protein